MVCGRADQQACQAGGARLELLGAAGLAHALQVADGVAALTYGGAFVPARLLPALARVVGPPQTRMVVGTYVLEDSNALVPIDGPLAGVVGASSIPPANSTPAMREYRRAFTKAFPGLPPSDAETPVALAFNDAMEGLLRGLEASDGDLSDGRQRLREELAGVRFDVPPGPVQSRITEKSRFVRLFRSAAMSNEIGLFCDVVPA